MSMRAAILARVSDAKQLAVGGDGGRHTLAGQFETLERMAAREGWPVVRVFEIPGESAYSSEYTARPLFAAAVEAAERREFDVLLVAEFSRFARNLRVGFDALYRLRRAGVRLIDERGIDYTADEDRAVMEAWSASKASRDHAGRVRRGIEAQFRRGLPVGDRPERDAVRYEETRNRRDVWSIPTSPLPEAHFATFPPALVAPCILAGSAPGGVVLDPFLGSGTTAMVAKSLNRQAVGIDLNAEYLEMAKRRCAQMALELAPTDEGAA